MGQELECRVRFRERTLTGKAQLETDYLLFRGEERLKLAFQDLTGVQAAGGVLKLTFAGGEAEFELGRAAEKWAGKILHPPSRLDKLGIKAGTAVRLTGEFDEDFREELSRQKAAVTAGKGRVDVVLFSARRTADMDRLVRLAAGMNADGALWVVYPKGVPDIREIEVIKAGRQAGLKDVKVARFSATHTALKFVVPLAAR
jgi:hypothetical protein